MLSSLGVVCTFLAIKGLGLGIGLYSSSYQSKLWGTKNGHMIFGRGLLGFGSFRRFTLSCNASQREVGVESCQAVAGMSFGHHHFFVIVGYHVTFLRVPKPNKEYNFRLLILSQP